MELTGIPTAAGCEDRVIEWISQWVGRRRGLRLKCDRGGNLIITTGRAAAGGRPLYITAHLDHPAFVVRAPVDRRTVEVEFRGNVHEPYFDNAPVELIDVAGGVHSGRVVERDPKQRPFNRYRVRLSRPGSVERGDLGRWAYRGRGRRPTIVDGLLYTPACDDLAGVAAALGAIDVLRRRRAGDVRLLLTRAEEVGFLGAIAACKDRSIPRQARLICLENSRSFAESPIGAGPILRVGDRIGVFSPELTNRLSALISEHQRAHPDFKAQRKLMAGGTCEATTFCAYGYEATCICLPLGNYHNMVDIDGVLSGKRAPRVGPEHIAIADFHGMVELLILAAETLDVNDADPIRSRMEELYRARGDLLD